MVRCGCATAVALLNLQARDRLVRREVTVIDYLIEPSGLVIQHLSERSTRRDASSQVSVATRFVFKTKHDVRQFVFAEESEGYSFEGKKCLYG